MTDREMLKFAAKAMGYELVGDGYACVANAAANEDGEKPIFKWNPPTDDGDCARMEAALGIDIEWGPVDVMSKSYGDYHEEPYANHNGDKNAARRKASCRVAAQIGREMP